MPRPRRKTQRPDEDFDRFLSGTDTDAGEGYDGPDYPADAPEDGDAGTQEFIERIRKEQSEGFLETLSRRANDKYDDDPASYYKWFFIALLLIAGSVVLDVLVPVNNWTNIARSALAIIDAYAFFQCGYWLVLRQADANASKAEKARETDPDIMYVPLREKYSPTRRAEQSLVIGAIVALGSIVTFNSAFYTLGGGVLISTVLGLLVYCRRSVNEMILDQAKLEDPRDLSDRIDDEDEKLTREALIEMRKEEIQAARDRRNRIMSDDEDDDQQDAPRRNRRR